MCFDAIGRYHYEDGWCARDAFRAAFSDDHPIVAELPYEASLDQVACLCDRHGITYHFGPAVERTFQRGEGVIWVLAPSSRHQRGHMVFCRDPQRVLDARTRGECVIAGWVLVE